MKWKCKGEIEREMDEAKAITTITTNKVAQLQLRLNKPTKARLGHNSMMKQFQIKTNTKKTTINNRGTR